MEATINANDCTTLTDRDCAAIWHPFTQAKTAITPIPIVRGKGIYLYTEQGDAYLDAISSWWSNLHGHSHPYIAEKIAKQARSLEHVIFADFTHLPAIQLAEKLLETLPSGYSKVFYSDNGSTCVETAMKIALQYWHNLNPASSKTKIIAFKDAYHGETFGAMSAAEKNHFNRPFWSFLFEVHHIDPPSKGKEEYSLKQLQEIISQGDVAFFIFEPLVQGVAGMLMHEAEGLDRLLQHCRENHVLTIADEVMTGFGRLETLFAVQQLTETPDMICMSKAMTGGFLPIAATVCKQSIYDQFLSDDKSKSLLHGHTYTANPIACAAALANLELLLADECFQQRVMIAKKHLQFCQQWQGNPKLARLEAKGTILALEYQVESNRAYFSSIRDRLYHYFLKHKLLLRPFGNVFYVSPPYCIQEDELDHIYAIISTTLEP